MICVYPFLLHTVPVACFNVQLQQCLFALLCLVLVLRFPFTRRCCILLVRSRTRGSSRSCPLCPVAAAFIHSFIHSSLPTQHIPHFLHVLVARHRPPPSGLAPPPPFSLSPSSSSPSSSHSHIHAFTHRHPRFSLSLPYFIAALIHVAFGFVFRVSGTYYGRSVGGVAGFAGAGTTSLSCTVLSSLHIG
ncbi:hypothetical protein K466DRAFT_139866 [Polyporus arcularius HHB13444]|uniref:Uncharacterized protein n=1 Tax=Polyporus arcularius HHB13444 TaxID=1314778 RepID=A0A5C3PAV1_9APHY|nr:hypothetical protein K466DRAFT_139866 [Polyporus arcularius HHB13444]